jgi:hypothetical protein
METKMKITKSILAQIIKEELDHFNESEIAAAAPEEAGAADLDQSKTDLQKDTRAISSSKLAQDIGNLATVEVKAQNYLRAIAQVLQAPGDQSDARVLKFLDNALKQTQAKVKG